METELKQGEKLHPNITVLCHERIGWLYEALLGESKRERAAEVIHRPIEPIELVPFTYEGRNIVAADLQGKLACIRTLATNAQWPLVESDLSAECTKLVAGVRSHIRSTTPD